MILMECADCQSEWESRDERHDNRCPECGRIAVHRKVSEAAVKRMRALLGTNEATPERLKAAFAACTMGGATFADAVLTKALELGYLELMDNKVWTAGNHKRSFAGKQDDR